jgi:hypothetical protein
MMTSLLPRLQRDFLRYQAANREAEHVDLLESERLDEGNGICAHLHECFRNLA